MPPRKTTRHLAIYLPHHLSGWRLPGASIEMIRRAARRRFSINLPQNEAAFVKVLPRAEVLFAWGLARRHVEKAKKLRWLHTPFAGVDRVLNPELLKTGIRVTSSRGVNAVAVADHTMALILGLTRGIVDSVRAQSQRRWSQDEIDGRRPPIEELSGKLLGILGLGEIGREISIRARAFGMKVWGLARRPRPLPEYVDRLLPAGKEDLLIRNADILVLALPLTPATRGMIGEQQLRRMKPDSLLINIGRGDLVQESALIRALREEWIAGAGLDVVAREPLPSSSPLWGMPHVLITPHIGGVYPDYMAWSSALFVKNLKSYARGRPLLNEIDRLTLY